MTMLVGYLRTRAQGQVARLEVQGRDLRGLGSGKIFLEQNSIGTRTVLLK
jgi:hypothetical protein